MDREKVIKGLDQFIADFKPFCGNEADWKRVFVALALLKAQEPMAPVRMNHTENKYRDHYRCPICKEDLSYDQNYCPNCGRAVKWE